MKAKRLVLAKKYKEWVEARWSKVFFLDEFTIQQFAQRKPTVRRPVRTRFNNCYTQATVKHPPSVMILGAMSSNNTAGLFFLPIGTTMNGVRYRKILEDKLKLHMGIHECYVFVQDGASCYRSKLNDFIKKKNIKMLNWPGNNPDLNPIENFQAILNNKVADEYPTSNKDLKITIKLI